MKQKGSKKKERESGNVRARANHHLNEKKKRNKGWTQWSCLQTSPKLLRYNTKSSHVIFLAVQMYVSRKVIIKPKCNSNLTSQFTN